MGRYGEEKMRKRKGKGKKMGWMDMSRWMERERERVKRFVLDTQWSGRREGVNECRI